MVDSEKDRKDDSAVNAGTGGQDGLAAQAAAIAEQPLVSVIIPAYNCEGFIEQCVRSVLEQSLSDIEVICVDDGSTDETPQLLDGLAEFDSRVRVIHQQNKGEGAARNTGLAVAQGQYLLFVDADDYLGRSALKKMYDVAAKHECDIVICGVSSFNTDTGVDTLVPWGCNWKAFPCGVFSAKDNPDQIFLSFQNWTWNKMFSSEFISQQKLRFDEVQRSADLYFVICALASAGRICCVPEVLYHYRTNNPSSNIATSDRAPLDFYVSFEHAQDWMKKHGCYGLVARAFKNWAASSVLYNFTVYCAWDSFCELYDYLRADDCAALRKLGLLDMAPGDYFEPGHYDQMRQLIESKDVTEFLFSQYRAANSYVEALSVADRSYQQARSSFGASARQLCRSLGHEALRAYYSFRA